MNKKKVLFMIGANELAEHKDIFITAVKKRIDLFKENSDKLDVDICLYPSDRNEWHKLNPGLAKELFELLDEAAEGKNINLGEIEIAEAGKKAEVYDAYYGSPSFMPLYFTGDNKPVMIADMSINL